MYTVLIVTEYELIRMINFYIDYIFVEFCANILQQSVCISMDNTLISSILLCSIITSPELDIKGTTAAYPSSADHLDLFVSADRLALIKQANKQTNKLTT